MGLCPPPPLPLQSDIQNPDEGNNRPNRSKSRCSSLANPALVADSAETSISQSVLLRNGPTLLTDPTDLNDLNMLLDCYNTTVRSLLDDHAPVCSRHVSTRPRPPWFNEDIIQARRDRRKAERRWRASGLQADIVVFKAKRNYVIHLMNEARCTYYKEFIDENSSDESKLFRASKSLLNL